MAYCQQVNRSAFPSLLLRAGLNYQWRHPWQALLALVGITMGVAVVLAVDLANSAARASFELSSAQIRGAATHRITGLSEPVPQSLYVDLVTSEGHPPMAPVIRAPVSIAGKRGQYQLIGLDLFAEAEFRNNLPGAIRGETSLGDWLSSPEALAISASAARQLGVGAEDSLMVRYQGRDYALRVMVVTEEDSAGSQDLLVVDLATAQAITGIRDGLSYIDLILDDTQFAELNAQLPPSVRLVDIQQQEEGVVGLSAAFELNLTAMSLLALLVGVFLIFNAISFSIVQRRNLMGRLRSLGVQTGEIYRVVFAEALVLGVIGTLLGLVIGILLGQGLTSIVAATVSELYYQVSEDAMRVEMVSLIKASLLGIAGTLIAAWIPAHQAARIPPLTTLSRTALEQSTHRQLPLLGIAGMVLLVTGLLISFAIPGGVTVGFVGLFIILLGAVLLTPLSLPLAHWLMSKLPLGGIWRMATRDLDRHISRLGTAAAALMIALSASVGVAVMVDSMRTSVSDWLQDLLTGDLYIAAEGFEEGAVLPRAVAVEAPLLDSVSDYSLYRDRRLVIGQRQSRLIAARLAEQSRLGFELVAVSGQAPWKLYDQGGILISEPLAHRMGMQPGERLLLPTPAGEKPFIVAAIFRDYASEHGRVFINRETYLDVWQDPEINTLALFSSDGEILDLRQRAGEQLGQHGALIFTDARAIYDESMAVFNRTFRITEVLRILSILVAFIGILTALMAVQLERRKEFAVLRALGLTRGQISGLIMAESVMLGLIAAILAIPTGLIMAWVLTDAIQLRAFGWTMPFRIDPDPLVLTLFLGLVAALMASLYPAWQASRSDPAPQLRED